MRPTNTHTDSFQSVVVLNEAAKQLVARASEVHLLALDASVQSKRAAGKLRGFDEVSSQMRMWSRELRSLVESLSAFSREVVVRTSICAKLRRTRGLLVQAAELSQDARAASTSERATNALEALELEVETQWAAVASLLQDLDQLGMMACVLSRSAMIEAASAEADQRRQLDLVSQLFYRHSEAVVGILKHLANCIHGR